MTALNLFRSQRSCYKHSAPDGAARSTRILRADRGHPCPHLECATCAASPHLECAGLTALWILNPKPDSDTLAYIRVCCGRATALIFAGRFPSLQFISHRPTL